MNTYSSTSYNMTHNVTSPSLSSLEWVLPSWGQCRTPWLVVCDAVERWRSSRYWLAFIHVQRAPVVWLTAAWRGERRNTTWIANKALLYAANWGLLNSNGNVKSYPIPAWISYYIVTPDSKSRCEIYSAWQQEQNRWLMRPIKYIHRITIVSAA